MRVFLIGPGFCARRWLALAPVAHEHEINRIRIAAIATASTAIDLSSGFEDDKGDAAITRAIVAMAHSFGMSVIAEGVETPQQLAFLRELGCEEFQGYLFSRPVPAQDALRCFDGYHPD